jgi:tRNA threonylcarbamoyladenosine biosynthesis protein TsaB
MKLLAIDTATERCSAALVIEDRIIERIADTPRGHADLILPMVEAVLQEGGLRLAELEGLAYGRGPGAFTGVRIAVGVAQGLAFGAGLLTVGVSDLAAVARQVAEPGEIVLVCMDARMGEVYWGVFQREASSGAVVALGAERVDRPEAVGTPAVQVYAGTGFAAYPQLAANANARVHADALPRARDVAMLAVPELRAGRGLPPSEAAPVYLRDQVVAVKTQ